MCPGKTVVSNIYTAVRYGLVGLLGTGLHFGTVIALVEWARLDPVPASALGFLLALVVSYILNRAWTFRSRRRGRRQFLAYAAVSLLGLGLNSAIMFLTVHVLRWNYLYGQALVVAVVPVVNYLLNLRWTFRDTEKESCRL